MFRQLALAAFVIMAVTGFSVLARAQESKSVNAQAASAVTSDAPAVNAEVTQPSAQASEAEVKPAVMEFNVNPAGNVTLDFREADIKNVLKVLAYKSKVNIIAGPEVVGMVNIQLKDVPWQKALEVILSTYGYSYEQRGTVMLVTTVENLKKRREDAKTLADQEPLTTEAFMLNFGKAEEIVKSLDKVKTARGSVNFDKRTNAVIVTDVQTNFQLIRDVVARLDAVTPQVMIEAKIVETSLDKNDKLGIDWTITGTASGSQRPTTFPFSSHSQSQFLSNDFPATTTLTSSTGAGFAFGTLNLSGLTATLDMLKSRADTNVLSNPRIVTLDNQAAKVQVGEQYPMPQYTTNAQTGVLQVTGWTYMDIGIIFEVTPHINNSQMVTLDIAPKITARGDTLPVSNTNVSASMPILTNESVTTSVMIRDGDTLVIAGLITDTVVKTVKRLPILGYIPILGWPFQHTVDTHQKKDLMIFLTPHIITPVMDKVEVK